MTERTGKELVDMISRIPDATVGQEIKAYFELVKDVQEARDLMQHFLEFYCRKR